MPRNLGASARDPLFRNLTLLAATEKRAVSKTYSVKGIAEIFVNFPYPLLFALLHEYALN